MKVQYARVFHRLRYVLLGSILVILQFGCSDDIEDRNGDFHLPDGFVIEPAVSPDLISFPMFATFDDQGRLFLFESTEPNDMSMDTMLANPTYHIRMLTDTDLDGEYDESVIFADKIPFPMGGTFHDGSLYAAAPPDLLKLTDVDGDGVADEREVLHTGWVFSNNGATLSGPFMGPDGWLYLTDARRSFDITNQEGERLVGKGTRIWRCLPDGSRLEWLSGGGFDNAIEIDFMPGGDPIGTMTYFRDPANGQRDALIHWVYGGVYPKYNAVIEEDELKLTGDLMPVITKMPRVAPSGLVRFQGDRWGNDYEGEWFSAIFNTGQILRHSIEPVGGSYQSEDQVFLSTDLPDFHPTDVLQDGNGDLLVIVTGGWFIHGCPLSRVSKPDVRGGVYRIKKKGDNGHRDPWGTENRLEEKSVEALSMLLDDPRPMVRQNALRKLEAKGIESFSVLAERYRSESDSLRLEMLFALHRGQTDEGRNLVREGLNDDSEDIRIASARLCGLEKDETAVPVLEMLVDSDPSLRVRRQCATALGQIGNTESVPALLEASRGVNDRFLLHAIRYALITLNEGEIVLLALSSEDSSMRQTALIVLDQMEDSPLSQAHVRPFLTSEDKDLQETGIWVLGHHPEWAGIVTDYIAGRLAGSTLADEDVSELEELLIRFCSNPKIQSFVHQTLNTSTTRENVRLAMLRVIGKCSGSVPNDWVRSLDAQLSSDSELVQSTALDVIEMRQIRKLESRLTSLLTENTEDPEFYLKLLNARLTSKDEVAEREFEQLLVYLDGAYSVSNRRSALQIINRANLTSDQLMTIAQQVIPTSDEITFAGLVRAFETDSDPEVGKMLVQSLQEKQEYLNAFTEQELTSILDTYPEPVRQQAAPILAVLRQQNAERRDQLDNLEAGLVKGDIGRGRDLFFGKAICSTCHTIGLEGQDFGPDLTTIGAIRSRHDLLEAIVFPSVSFAREYETYLVKTTEKTYTGVLKQGMESGVVVIEQAPGLAVRIPEHEIVSMEIGEVSLMPAGLDKSLTHQELSDLIAFLEALPYTVERLLELAE